MRKYQICNYCVMDTSDPEIQFNERGRCNHCTTAEILLNQEPISLSLEKKKQMLEKLINKIKKDGKSSKYDCVIGLSGGVDSSYVAILSKDLGLRPLAVHLDNGWNSELSVQNIENICTKLEIDLYTYVINWEEFKDLQLAFLKASTPDSEIPSDHAITSILYHVARRRGIKYILGGTNINSESILPPAWSQGHSDWRYIKSLQTRFGTVRLKTFPHRSLLRIFLDKRAVNWVHILNFVDYDKEFVKEIIARRVGWRDYGRKHGESNYTRIFQEYILPRKFGFDKRRAHLSSLIVSGQLTRELALEKLKEPLYISNEKQEEDILYLINKFGISRATFDMIMATPPHSIHDYPNNLDTWYYKLARSLILAIKASK